MIGKDSFLSIIFDLLDALRIYGKVKTESIRRINILEQKLLVMYDG
jgi:hypothetical protein